MSICDHKKWTGHIVKFDVRTPFKQMLLADIHVHVYQGKLIRPGLYAQENTHIYIINYLFAYFFSNSLWSSQFVNVSISGLQERIYRYSYSL